MTCMHVIAALQIVSCVQTHNQFNQSSQSVKVIYKMPISGRSLPAQPTRQTDRWTYVNVFTRAFILRHTCPHMKTYKHCRQIAQRHTHSHTDRHSISKRGIWNTKQSKWDERRRTPSSPDSQTNGVDEVKWKSLYVSGSLSVSALITQQVTQYSSLTFSLPHRPFPSASLSFLSPYPTSDQWGVFGKRGTNQQYVCVITREHTV